MRSTEYDTVSDRYARFLRDEILADVGAGGICSFNAAWQMQDAVCRAALVAESARRIVV
jgi:enterochelin esterase family protein